MFDCVVRHVDSEAIKLPITYLSLIYGKIFFNYLFQTHHFADISMPNYMYVPHNFSMSTDVPNVPPMSSELRSLTIWKFIGELKHLEEMIKTASVRKGEIEEVL